MKKLLIGSALAALCSAPAFAKDTANPSAFTGPYIGVYAGYDWSELDTNFGLDADPRGWDGGGFIGYRFGKLMENSAIGTTASFEAFYGISNADDSVAGINVEKDHEWGVSFRPGIALLSTTTLSPYGIVGYRRTQFEGSSGGFAGSEDYNGLELGIGTELMAFGNAGLRLEYAHVWYGDENGIDPDSDDLRLGMSYHF